MRVIAHCLRAHPSTPITCRPAPSGGLRLVVVHDAAWMEHDDAFWFYGFHERRCFGDFHECADCRERVIHCGPADEINPQATVVFEELPTQIARALAKPVGGPGRNLQELVAIHSRFEPVDDNLE